MIVIKPAKSNFSSFLIVLLSTIFASCSNAIEYPKNFGYFASGNGITTELKGYGFGNHLSKNDDYVTIHDAKGFILLHAENADYENLSMKQIGTSEDKLAGRRDIALMTIPLKNKPNYYEIRSKEMLQPGYYWIGDKTTFYNFKVDYLFKQANSQGVFGMSCTEIVFDYTGATDSLASKIELFVNGLKCQFNTNYYGLYKLATTTNHRYIFQIWCTDEINRFSLPSFEALSIQHFTGQMAFPFSSGGVMIEIAFSSPIIPSDLKKELGLTGESVVQTFDGENTKHCVWVSELDHKFDSTANFETNISHISDKLSTKNHSVRKFVFVGNRVNKCVYINVSKPE